MDTNVRNNFEQKAFVSDLKQYKIITALLTACHVYFLIASIIFHLKYMLIINIFSVIFYLVSFPLLNSDRNKLKIYAMITLAEIMSHVFLAACILGWENGFQTWLFGLLVTFMFPFIVPDRTRRESVIGSIVMTSLVMIEYGLLYYVTHFLTVPFRDYLPSGVATFLGIDNAVITFFSIALCGFQYTKQMEFKYSQLHNMADFDQLTGLGNRYYMNDILTEYEGQGKKKNEYSVAMLDIDFFKSINDTYGHDNGDKVLVEIANILSSKSTDSIKAGRWGGEEFLIVSGNEVKYSDFKDFMEKIRQEISEKIFTFNNKAVHCTVSIGVSHSHKGISPKDVIKKADDNLYIAKESGRNRLVA
ncbi:MAG: GGDEF domain-containing protein [Butyrivibrio sp.]|nr:GGDEF domain-containing protein [Butyrivibrio sp.]